MSTKSVIDAGRMLRLVLRIDLRTPVRPTEDPAKVEAAVRNLFPDAETTRRAGELVATSGNLDHLAEVVAKHLIPDTARMVMLRGREGATATFRLGKLAAFMGKPNFGVESPGPLGDIEVTLAADDERELLYAIYRVGFDTTVPERLARVPREYREPEDEA